MTGDSMTRSKWLLILLLPLLFGFDTRNPFKTRGPFKTAATTIGGTSGVEAKYIDQASDAHVVARCSEPMDGPNGEQVSNSGSGFVPDNTLSPDASECWGRGGDWQDASYQYDAIGQTIVPVTGWGSVGYAAKQPGGAGDWWLAYKGTQIASDFGLTSATICWRYYKQVETVYQTASYNCPGFSPENTTRNKLTEIDNERPGSPGLYDAYQIQEDQHDGCSTDIVSDGRGIMACYGSGPGNDESSPGGPCPWLDPTVRLRDGITHPLRVEQCYETTDLATGANGRVRAYITPYPYTTTSTHDTPSGVTLGPMANDGTTGGDIDHTGSGVGYHGYFMFTVWDDVGGHTIGAACEIEGGC